MILNSRKNFQGGFGNKVFNEYERLQDLVRSETDVECSILITPETLSIRCREYSDYLLARKVLKPRTRLEIIWDRPQ